MCKEGLLLSACVSLAVVSTESAARVTSLLGRGLPFCSTSLSGLSLLEAADFTFSYYLIGSPATLLVAIEF